VKQAVLRAVGTAPPSLDLVNIAPGEAVLIELGDKATLDAVISRECGRPALRGDRCAPVVTVSASRRVRESRDHAEKTLRSLLDLVRALGSLDGPKHLVFLTGSLIELPALLPAIREVSEAAAAARVHVHAVPLPKAYGFQSAQARTSNASEWISGADPASAAGTLALSTGGFSSTFLAPRAAFDRLERELSAAYLLAFEPGPGDRDGKSHAIDVTIGLPNTKVRSRRQFRVIAPEAVASTSAAATPASPTPGIREAAPATSRAAELPRVGASSSAAPDPVLTEFMGRVGAYIEQFEREFSSVVAEEHYVQIAKPWTGPPTSFEDEPALLWEREAAKQSRSRIRISRRIRSDVLLVQSADDLWVSYRDVFEVDGKPVRNRDERVRQLFLSASGGRAELRRINSESSRYNIGVGVRTVNTPTFALLYLHSRRQSRVRFVHKGTEVIDGHACTVIEYRESQRPALVSTTKGESVLGEGRFWAEPETGRVRRIESTLALTAASKAVLQVTFGEEPGINVLVPTTMWEWYTGAPARLLNPLMGFGTGNAYIEALARYSNLRRFRVETVERIK
jgi:hypothetical protein